jgi:hypothetical protein
MEFCGIINNAKTTKPGKMTIEQAHQKLVHTFYPASNSTAVEVIGISNFNYAKDTETRRSVSDHSIFVKDVPVSTKSKMQGSVTLFVTEAELLTATHYVQEMIYT